MHAHQGSYWHDFRGDRTESTQLAGDDPCPRQGPHVAAQARRRRSYWFAGADREEARGQTPDRQRLITEQTANTNRMKALLRLIGMPVGNPRRRDWLIWLERQRDWQGQPVPPQLMAELKHEHARLMLLRDQ